MSAASEDVVARAEIRRRKILENAQRRLNSVLSKDDKEEVSTCQSSDSTISNQINVPIVQTTPIDTCTVYKSEDLVDSVPVMNGLSLSGNCVNVLNTTNTKSTPKPALPIDQNELFESMVAMGSQSLFPNNFDFNKHLELLGNNSTSISQDRKEDSKQHEVPSHLKYAALAVVVRLMLYFQIGWMFGEMILVPFMLTESIQLSLGHVHTSHLITMFTQVMTLCGVSSQHVQIYGKVNSILLHCIEDFSVYLVVFCIIHRFLDEDLESR